ncbi:hypothetical protein BGZ96_009734 [Linnemannia gamsii]|uniref:Integrase n=1 Tax=Linnemannia gamsii TaxID=64522 RepID=A0ABQ7JXL3_9FUNG|nr:hypothetical protein BGZ96_009734 [Linnemannia gamsii]
MAYEPLEVGRPYTAKDYAALRGFVQRLPAAVLVRTYYSADDPVATTPAALERHLMTMRDHLIDLALEHGNAPLVKYLKDSLKRLKTEQLTATVLRMVVEAAQLAETPPKAEHAIGLWFKPKVTKYLKGEGLTTLKSLIEFCNARGGTWWRSVPRIGAGRAKILVAWLRRHEETLGLRVGADVEFDAPVPVGESVIIGLELSPHRLAPLERLHLVGPLSGEAGINRSPSFCFIQAHHDLAAVRTYLHRFRDQPKTLRAYTKELERFVLWAVMVRRKALSSCLVEDCEAYKDFLMALPADFIGPRRARNSSRWRPFAQERLSANSQRYAIQIIRSAFAWLVDVRYLSANPWQAVNDPVTITPIAELQLERALSASLWQQVRQALNTRCAGPDGPQWRLARAAILLMGDSGLRREETAGAQRENLTRSQVNSSNTLVWELIVVGKRNRARVVPISGETLSALCAHWQDRGLDFEASEASGPLISPLVHPSTPAMQRKIAQSEHPYHAESLSRLVKQSCTKLARDEVAFTEEERQWLTTVSAHAFRHTFGTQAAAYQMPIEVVKKVMGHMSIDTTSIYVQAEKKRMIEAAAAYYARE